MKIVITFIKKYWLPIVALIVSLLMFTPSINGFFTNDEFFLLKIAKISSLKEFLNFFNPVMDYAGLGAYRPLTLRVYYFLSVNFFGTNPLPLRIISFVTFYMDVFLVGYLANLLIKNIKIAYLTAFLYAVSVTHFGHLYYTGAFQELLMSLFFLASVIFFAKYEIDFKKKGVIKNLMFSFLFFILSLMSKEAAVVLPGTLLAVHLYLRATKRTKITFRQLTLSLLPFAVLLGTYLFLHFRYFGLVQGDSYIWDFSLKKAVNTTVWYSLWSLNLPETLVDFVGPGIHLNPNLMKYWSAEMIPIFVLFAIQTLIIVYALIKSFKSSIINHKSLFLFSILWFILTILPVVFLPLHKFTYYLTLPLFGVVFLLSYIIHDSKFKILYCLVWVALSIFSLHLTKETNWITKGSETAKNVYTYISENKNSLKGKTITFIDTSADKGLPWSPTGTLKIVLADQNFFEVFYPGEFSGVSYGGEGNIKIVSRQFLGY